MKTIWDNLKKLIRSRNLPLEQVSKRLYEKEFQVRIKYNKQLKESKNNPKLNTDKYILLKNSKIMVVNSIYNTDNGCFLSGQIYQTMQDAFVSLLPSKIVKVWKVNDLSTHLFEVPIDEYVSKCMFVEVDGTCYILELLN